MPRDLRIIPNRNTTGSTQQPTIYFSGTTVGSINLKVEDDGSVVFEGNNGGLFNITDSKDGLLSSVNDVSGLPIFSVYSSDKIIAGGYNQNALIVDNDKVFIGSDTRSVPTGTKLTVSGNTLIIGTLSATTISNINTSNINALSLSANTISANTISTTDITSTNYFLPSLLLNPANTKILTTNSFTNKIELTDSSSLATIDYYVTGGTFSTGTLTLFKGNGNVVITGFTSTDTYVTGITYSNNNITILSNENKPNLTVKISLMTGLTINGNLLVNQDITTSNIKTNYIFDRNNNSGLIGQVLVNTPLGVEWQNSSDCNSSYITTNGLESKLIGVISGFTNGTYIIKSYVTSFSGTSKYGIWERTLGVVTTGGTPNVVINSEEINSYSPGFLSSQVTYLPQNNNQIEVYVSGLTAENLYWESYFEIIGQDCGLSSQLSSSSLGSFGTSVNNGTNVVTLGQKGYVKMPYPGTITDWSIMANQTGNVVIDLWKTTFAAFPPTVSNSILNGNYLTLSNQQSKLDPILTGWTSTSFLAGDVFTFNILSADTITNLNLTINVLKT
jgi:hypothetical protein